MRVALHTRLKLGSERAYDDAHRQVPAELVSAMRRAAARTWRIWHAELDVFQLIECDDYGASSVPSVTRR